MKSFFKLAKTHYFIVAFLMFFFAITAYKFIAHPTPFYDWDESIYAQVGREMVQQKSLVPLWQGQAWLDKPPLVPLAYGIVESIIPVKPEISTRLFTLSLTVILFIFIYAFYFKLTKNKFIAVLTVVISSFTAIMLQRAQVLNVDIFLFIGWMGYMVFFENFWFSFFFLVIGVMSKSLLGFYPALGMLCILFGQIILKQKTFKQQKNKIIGIIAQILIVSSWFAIMVIRFKFPFIQAQFLDSQLKRVTSSIESHFGKRTFYIDLLFSQLGIFDYASLIGICLACYRFFKKKNIMEFGRLLFFVPWFLFLNLTKTKINWYLYPVIPQFAFLAVYILVYLKKQTRLLMALTLIISGLVVYQNISHNRFFDAQYSNYDESYYAARYAKNNCKDLTVLVDKDTRTTHDTLQSMNLLIHTSKWWGNHPAIVYYSDENVNFVYSVSSMERDIQSIKPGRCFMIYTQDFPFLSADKSLKISKTFSDFSIYKQ